MRTGTRIAGVATAAAAMLAIASPAFADTANNNGINLGEDNNVSAVPVQLCGNNIPVIGATLSLGSPQADKCVNAPIVDHPTVGKGTETTPPQDNGGCPKSLMSPQATERCLNAPELTQGLAG